MGVVSERRKECEVVKHDMLSVKVPMDTTIGSHTGRLIGMPPTPTALAVSLAVLKCMVFVALIVEREPEMMLIFH